MTTIRQAQSHGEWRQQAHDIKNIMATIFMVAEELGAGAAPREHTLSRRLERSCIRVLEICGAAHDLTPSTTGGQPLSQIIEDVATLARGLAETDVEVGVDCDAVTVCEETGAAVFRILANLSTNAVGALAGRKGCIEIKARVRGGEVEITVADDGPGIRAAHGRRDSRAIPRRSGLGLTIATELADRIGGELTLVKTGPKGTVFRLTFPASPGVPF